MKVAGFCELTGVESSVAKGSLNWPNELLRIILDGLNTQVAVFKSGGKITIIVGTN